MPDKQDKIEKQTKVGILWNTMSRVVGTFGQFVGGIFIARLLGPEEMGVFAMGMMVIGFATKFGEFGFHMGLVQRKDEVTAKHINSLFVMDLVFKIALWIIVWFSSPYIAQFFNEPQLLDAMPVIALYMVLECFSMTPLTLLRREMDFKSYSIIITAERLLVIPLAIVFALFGFQFWSLVYSKLIGVIISAIMAIHKTRWVPALRFDSQAGKELFSFGSMVFLRNLFRYGADNVDYFFIGRYLGTAQFGFYERAFQTMKLPQRRITRSINSVVFSTFSRIQDDPKRIRRAFRKLVLAISLVSYPLMAGLAFLAPIMVPVLYGEEWLPTVFPLQAMCIAGILRSIDPFLNSVLTATGYVRTTVYRRAFEFVVVGAAAYYGVQYGIDGVAIAISVAALLVMVVMVQMVTSASEITWGDYLFSQLPGLIASAGMVAVMYLIQLGLGHWIDPMGAVMLIILTIAGGGAYLGLHFMFRFKRVTELVRELSGDTKGGLGKLRKKWNKLRKAIPAFRTT